jgi:hypothetical protein
VEYGVSRGKLEWRRLTISFGSSFGSSYLLFIDGYVYDNFTKEPVANADILAFVGSVGSLERPYVFSVFDASTDDQGHYDLECPLYRDYIELVVGQTTKETNYTIYAYEGLVKLTRENATIEGVIFWFFHFNFTVIHYENWS